jgi:hypothetical protein
MALTTVIFFVKNGDSRLRLGRFFLATRVTVRFIVGLFGRARPTNVDVQTFGCLTHSIIVLL